ncbi:hypothetical protein WJX72_003177 [[Myrmecia] bisecta]|uniref:Protein PTHB1 n=1 Tax=[Myrmecia] bisecta TaxID=41462 RepID=A0AAW1PWU9_9CHLO
MSLFCTREWWGTGCSRTEDFLAGGLCVGNFDGAPDGQDKIAVASLQGVLRVYQPQCRDARVEDLLLELNLQLPILQLQAGCLFKGEHQQLAILHPRSLVLYATAPSAGQAGGLALQQKCDFRLARTAASMVVGRFGETTDVDSICVQSMDGQLSFFVDGACAFECFLPGFLAPGPLCYCAAIDSLVTSSSALDVQCFRYSRLASATHTLPTQEQPSLHEATGKRLQPDWTYVLGEAPTGICFARFLADEQVGHIVVVGERSLTCLDGHGKLQLQKRLDFVPVAHVMLPAGGGRAARLLLVAPSGQLLVFGGQQLLWLAAVGLVPCAMRIGSFGGERGLLVGLEASGKLSVSYLGTKPPAPGPNSKRGAEPDYVALEAEHQQLKAAMRQAESCAPVYEDGGLLIAMQARSVSDAEAVGWPSGGSQAACVGCLVVHVLLSYLGPGQLTRLQLSLQPPAGVLCDQEIIEVAEVKATSQTPLLLPLTCWATRSSLPGSSFGVVGVYLAPGGRVCTASAALRLPLTAFCHLVAPVHTGAFKLTITTDQPPHPLTLLFADIQQSAQVAPADAGNAADVMTVQYHTGDKATLLVSKTAGRYRAQADSFEALGLLLEELVHRLNEQGAPPGQDLHIFFQDALPLQDWFALLDGHESACMEAAASRERLAQCAAQFRAAQKRLLLATADRTPVPLLYLQLMLHETAEQLRSLGDAVEASQQAVQAAGHKLAAGCRLLLLLVRYHLALPGQDVERLASHLYAQAIHMGDWEEIAKASLAHLLQTTFSDTAGKTGSAAVDAHDMKGMISFMLERLLQGARLSPA